ncbi:cyclase family protein [Microbacterium barkeri]|uniref:cyclase family protein n=1 Tax=Microbacterium barkeri TaxID=33917 RepID=UPI0022F26999|nr:cyclase family protein [Microbacterium barkeri]MDR6875528.1 kynurenine formamidase [Microbacterium barkeri]
MSRKIFGTVYRRRMRDLSHPIRTGMTVYPGDPAVRIEPALEIARDGVAVAALHLGSHTGTHLDAPSHVIAGGRTTGAIPLDELVGEAIVLHLGEVAAGAVITLDDLRRASADLEADLRPVVVLDTGWAERFGSADATAHPHLDRAAAAWLVAHGMRVLAVDLLSPDPTGGEGFPVHEIVLGADALIVENLRGLAGLERHPRIGVFPLAIDADGAPARVVAL